MKAKVISVSMLKSKDGGQFNRVFAVLPDGTVGNFFTPHNFKIGDEVTFVLGIDKECKFVVRPLITQ